MLLPLFLEDLDLLFLDEIFTGLDANAQSIVMTQLIKKHRNGATIVLIEHNESLVEQFKQTINLEEAECINGKLLTDS